MVTPPLGKLQLLLGSEHRKFADLLEIPRKIALWGDVDDGRDHDRLLSSGRLSVLPYKAQDDGRLRMIRLTKPDGCRFKARELRLAPRFMAAANRPVA
jgi:hypothetical protein